MDKYLSRFGNFIKNLPLHPVNRILELGSAEGQSTETLMARYPAAAIYGVDDDLAALQRVPPPMQPILADVRALPFNMRFDLIVIRHPDIDRSSQAWEQAIRGTPALLAPGGLLIVTCYSLPEAERLRGWLDALPLMPMKLPETLSAPDLSGRDRFIFSLAYPS